MRSLICIFICLCSNLSNAQLQEREIDRLKLVGKVSTIVETSYEMNENNEKKLSSKYTATFHPNGTLKSKEHVFYKNDTVASVYKSVVDARGNIVETYDYFPAHILKRQAKLAFDAQNNKISLITTDEGRKSNLTYRNTYDSRNRLVEKVLVSKGRDLKKYNYEYDANDNMVKELIDSDYLKATNAYLYDGKNLIEYWHIRNGEKSSHFKNFYVGGLLDSKIYYEADGQVSRTKKFAYNDKKLLITEKEPGFGDETRFLAYDNFGNWKHQERDTGGKLRYIVDRVLTYH